MKEQVKELILNKKYYKKQICDELNINKRQLNIVIKQLKLQTEVRNNAYRYTNKNLKNKQYLLRLERLDVLKNNGNFDDVKRLILEGFNVKQINKKIKITNNDIVYISKYYNINDTLKLNQQIQKSIAISQKARIIREERYKELLKQYSNILKQYIIVDKLRLGQIIDKIPELSKNVVNNLIILLNLKKEVQNNYHTWNVNNCKINTIKARNVNLGKKRLLHKITIEMEQFYLKLLEQNEFDGKGRKLFHKQFLTSGNNTWNYLINKFGKLKKHPSKFLPGKLNKMYGKSPTNNAGFGINGSVILNGEKLFFRSLLELKVYLYLYINNINFTQSKHRVKYVNNCKQYTYCPDIVINDTIYEIKPENLQTHYINTLKFNSLKVYCNEHNLKCEYIGYKTYDLTIITKQYILNMINNKLITMTDKQYNRLIKNLK